MGFYDNAGPGYQNPLGKDAPSWNGDYDWKNKSGGIDWGSKFDIDKTNLYESTVGKKDTDWGGVFSGLFDKAKDKDKYRGWGERSVSFGQALPGTGGQVLENLGVIYPQQHAPLVLQGQEGKRGLGGTIGRLAGGIAGAVIGGPIGGLVGGLGGAVGGLFD
jgi:hypothetical protein